jgi:hypothetical protein
VKRSEITETSAASMIMQSVDDGSRYLEEELGIERKRRMNRYQSVYARMHMCMQGSMDECMHKLSKTLHATSMHADLRVSIADPPRPSSPNQHADRREQSKRGFHVQRAP